MNDIERCIREQRSCADYRGPDIQGAWAGLMDWILEEVYILDIERTDSETAENDRDTAGL